MPRYTIIVAFGVVSLLFAAMSPWALWAQERRTLTDFRERSSYTTEDLEHEIFTQHRGLGPPSVALKVYFAPNSNRILTDYYGDLNKLGEALSSPQYTSKRLQIEGHTDNVGSEKYNQVLSAKRAESVKQYLVQHFPIAPERLVTMGYGKTRPIAVNDTEEGRQKNRRIEVMSLPQ